MDTRAAARAWVDAWSRAWPAADSEPLAEVYAQDAVFRSHPFREPQRGREGVLDYARWAFADQEGFGWCSFGEPVVAGDRAVVELLGRRRRARRGDDRRGRRPPPLRSRRPRPLPARLLGRRAGRSGAAGRLGRLVPLRAHH